MVAGNFFGCFFFFSVKVGTPAEMDGDRRDGYPGRKDVASGLLRGGGEAEAEGAAFPREAVSSGHKHSCPGAHGQSGGQRFLLWASSGTPG